MTNSHSKPSKPVQTPRKDGITALYLGCNTNKLPSSPKPIWLPIYRMSWDDNGFYHYSFTKAFEKHYEQLKGHWLNPNCGFNQTWITKHLDTRFSTRIPRRSDSIKGYHLLGIPDQEEDSIAYLARCGGYRVGDNYSIFPEVKKDLSDYYNFYFSISNKQFDEKNWFSHQDKENFLKLQPFKLEIEQEQTKILYQDEILGFCPEYINYLLNSPIYQKHQLEIDQIVENSILIKVKLRFASSPWLLKEFRPLNTMEV